MIIKTAFYSLAATSILAISSSASASNMNTEAVKSAAISQGNSTYILAERQTAGHIGDQFLGSSTTATFFYKKGVSNFEKGNLDKAEQSFKAVLRADGTKALDKITLHYLSYINQKQGDAFEAKKHAQTYLSLKKN